MSPRRTARVVPRLVFSASFIGVVPACALVGCGGTTTSQDGGSDAQFAVADVAFGVAAVAYCCFDAGVADAGFVIDASDAAVDASDGD